MNLSLPEDIIGSIPKSLHYAGFSWSYRHFRQDIDYKEWLFRIICS